VVLVVLMVQDGGEPTNPLFDWFQKNKQPAERQWQSARHVHDCTGKTASSVRAATAR